MNGLKAVTDLSVYLSDKVSVKVFKYEKEDNYNDDYVVVNSLPFTWGKPLNDDNALNVNIHCKDLKNGAADTKRINELCQEVYALIPTISSVEDDNELIIDGAAYAIENDSNAMKDNDNTHFINFVVKVKFNN